MIAAQPRAHMGLCAGPLSPARPQRCSFTARCAREICAYHAGGGGLKLCSFPDAASLRHTICVRAPGSSGSSNGCQHHALQSHFSFSRAQGVCGPLMKLLPLLLTRKSQGPLQVPILVTCNDMLNAVVKEALAPVFYK